jgi:hypothetical protein
MNNRKMKKDLKHLDEINSRVLEWNKEFDLGNLLEQIAKEKIKIVDKIGKKNGQQQHRK